MQFDARHRDEIRAGTVTVTFRRWARRQAVLGNRYRTLHGIIEADAVDVVNPDGVTAADAHRAGYPSVEELLSAVPGDPTRPLYRVEFHLVDEPDPRAELAADDDLGDQDRADIDGQLDRLDRASSHGPWTRATLALIAEHPAVRAADLAATVGRETAPFKLDVRKLKNLGLTESLEVGYRLSPRGRAYLDGT
ncbi:MAG: ASCH domain-containing protein [Acidimicrobiia bacterium]|nr:ASCH domain-containing protein [Acidimicrobiia bacterium]